MNRGPEQPRRSQGIIQRNHRRSARQHIQQVQQDFREIIGLYRTTGNANDRDACAGLPFPSEVIRQAHTTCRISFHGMDSAVRRASSCRYHRPGPRGQFVDPVARRDRLSRHGIRSKTRPIPFFLVFFIRNRAFDYQYKRRKLPFRCFPKKTNELISVLESQEGIVKSDFGYPWQGPENQFLDARLRGCRHSDRVSIATQSRGHPKDIDLRNGNGNRSAEFSLGCNQCHFFGARLWNVMERAGF